MALRLGTEPEWTSFFSNAGIPEQQSGEYAKIFVDNRMNETIIGEISKDYLKDLGITVVGDILAILKHCKAQHTPTSLSDTTNKPPPPPPPKLPQLTAEMTLPQFRKFKIDWTVFKNITSLPDSQTSSQLYNACNESVQSSLINTTPNFFTLPEAELLTAIESIVTQKSNPTVHRMTFTNLSQGTSEFIQDYVVRLKSHAVDCEFSCPSCQHDLTSVHVKDQFIRGICNQHLQTDILAKANQLKELTDIVKHAEAFETAVRDQHKLTENADASVSRVSQSDYKKAQRFNLKKNYPKTRKPPTPCTGCGSNSHGSWERSTKCPAWGTTCEHCNYRNHSASVCRSKETESANALMAQLGYDSEKDTFTKNTQEIHLITAQLIPFTPEKKFDNTPVELSIFPDSGASICIAGPQHLQKLGIATTQLVSCKKNVKTVGGSLLVCHGWLPVKFIIGEQSTKQPLYICNKIDRIYFSRKGCTETNILPSTFPFPMADSTSSISSIATEHSNITTPTPTPTLTSTPVKNEIPPRPKKIPLPPTEENITKLEKILLDDFASTSFNNSTPFPTMSGPPVHIHLKPNSKPVARHSPFPVPYHWKEAIKAALDADVERGIIQPVPIGSPTEWCSPMVITLKKDGSPRRTIDLQNLNSQCLRETHHTPSPFQLACQVPAETKKTVLDAVDGYHAVALDSESQPLTTFITEWGRYMYVRTPQGFLAAGDAYTRRYDELIKDVQKKVKCVDDTLLYDNSIEEAFFHTWDYLTLCAKNGIVINKDKFQFCRDTVTFAGLTITPHGITPSEKLLSAIKNFPPPKDITGARSWLGLVNQTAWAYAISDLMLPFRELVKHNSKFKWDATLQRLFEESKAKLLEAVTDGIRTFDTARPTCIQCDWSKDGIGYLLLQQHCTCPINDAPNCCPNGWKLVYAGSRFTTDTESRYAPTEGEALAIAWSLDHARLFILGCQTLVVITDHKPLLGIFGTRDLGTIVNPRIQRFKSKTLRYRFTVQHCPGKWHRGPDAVSRYPTELAACTSTAYSINIQPEESAENEQPDSEDALNHLTINAIHELNNPGGIPITSDHAITLDRLRNFCQSDEVYQLLLKVIQEGFPRSQKETPPSIRNFWGVRDRLTAFTNIVLLDQRLVIPPNLRTDILKILHSAHQGCTGMKARADTAIYWPGMNASILNYRAQCRSCTTHAPSQSKEPMILTTPPEWPFQKICADYFEVNGHSYLTVVDRFSGWICIFYFKHSATAAQLVTECRSLFAAYGAPEEFSSDGGPQLKSQKFNDFLSVWGVHHRQSSAYYPQSNGRAELGVKASKRMIYDNTCSDGSIDNDKITRAIMQYRNTPLPGIKLSPAQILLHRQLRDHLPAHPSHYHLHDEWLKLAKQREPLLHNRNTVLLEKYNASAHPLEPLKPGTQVVVQNKGTKHRNHWNCTGLIVEALPYRQYTIRMDGSGRITQRNRRFIRHDYARAQPAIIPAAHLPLPRLPDSGTEPNTPVSTESAANNDVPCQQRSSDPTTADTVVEQNTAGVPPASTTNIVPHQPRPVGKVPRALQNLVSYNSPGLIEQSQT